MISSLILILLLELISTPSMWILLVVAPFMFWRINFIIDWTHAVLFFSWSIEFLFSVVLTLFLIIGGISSLHGSKEENFLKSEGESSFNLILMSSSSLKFNNLFCCRDSSPPACDFYPWILFYCRISSTVGFILL